MPVRRIMTAENEPVRIFEKRVPRREGVGDGAITSDDGPLYHKARVSKAAGLKDLEGDYAFFSHALLFTHGRWGVDPIRDYVAKMDPTCCPFVIQLSRPVFRGLTVGNNSSWDHLVMAVHRPSWDGLRAFLGSLSGVDRDAKRYHRIVVQEMPLVDVLALERETMLPDPVPTTSVTLFALEGNWGTVGYKPARRPPLDRIKVVTLSANADVIKMAVAIFRELEKPFQAIEPTVEEAERRARKELTSDR